MKKVLLVLVIALAVTAFACQKKTTETAAPAAVADNATVQVETVIIDEVIAIDNATDNTSDNMTPATK